MREELHNFKRGRIIEAACKLFYERGFVGSTIDSIAEELKVTKPFVYQYFKSKHEILAAVVEREIKRVIELLDEVNSTETEPAERLRQFIRAWVEENIEVRQISIIFWQEQQHFPAEMREHSRTWQKVLNQRLTTLIREGDEIGTFHSGNPQLAAFAITGALQWIPRWFRPNGPLNVEDVSQYFADLALRMVNLRP
jgi:AcrR family transcriptional regulator